MTMNTISITSGQEKQFKRFVEDAADKALAEVGLDKDGLQKLIENGDEFQARIITDIRELSVSNQFADEERESSYVYSEGYKVKGITAQTNILRQLIPGIGFADEKLAEQPLPPNAEGWFAIPRWQKVAKTYGEAVEKVLELIKQQHKGKFYNWCEGKLGEQYLRQHERTAKKLQVLGDQQKDYDIMVVPAQFGLCHRGRSVRRAREVFTTNEFGLGAFEIGCMLLTHPERLVSFDDLWIDCAGDEYAPVAVGVFSHAPCFRFGGGEVRFDSCWFEYAFSFYGSASAFLSKSDS
ncbi:MAG: hypothetical protein COT32_02485 [Candidatus Nealsonbacteria bacterium CG08_land_8_20_14_0_20_36_22]|uniref:Uncharacterized protein n=2 Tax=Candidatus Nealsoniibacteriota TaxID=1817911 RepID=A0A2H0YNT1_9BACT|nr:MAG: hypothetical protein COT32_02485 [Candidatus Nealsonbacteria bacterium CG08_land_8_20_14_0_20_36_22]